jgi:predicted small metal-binding protein
MHEHKHNVTCPVCSGTLGADTEAELIDVVQRHAKDAHDKDLSSDQVLEMAKAYKAKA